MGSSQRVAQECSRSYSSVAGGSQGVADRCAPAHSGPPLLCQRVAPGGPTWLDQSTVAPCHETLNSYHKPKKIGWLVGHLEAESSLRPASEANADLASFWGM